MYFPMSFGGSHCFPDEIQTVRLQEPTYLSVTGTHLEHSFFSSFEELSLSALGWVISASTMFSPKPVIPPTWHPTHWAVVFANLSFIFSTQQASVRVLTKFA